MLIIAAWMEGYFTLGLMGLAYLLACALAEAGMWLWNRLHQGRRACAWCRKDMGPAPELARGQVTHGICPACMAAQIATDVSTGDPLEKVGAERRGLIEVGTRPGVRAGSRSSISLQR